MALSRGDSTRRRRVSYEGIRQYNGEGLLIEFTLERTSRQTIGLTVFPGGRVRVRAPFRAGEDVITAFVAGRERWIVEKLERLATIPVAGENRFGPGYVVPFLGRQRMIVAENPDAPKQTVHLRKDRIVVSGARTPAAVHRVVYRYYREAALRVFRQRVRRLRAQPMIALLGEPKGLSLRLMRRRWGSCFTDRRVVLNPELFAADISEIDYVILHELCHFREHNHSSRFYRLLHDRMPDWQQRRERLNRTIPIGFLRAP